MPYTDEGKFVMLNGPGLRPSISSMSLHSAKPPSRGNELTRGIYSRQPIDLKEPAEGEMSTQRSIRFDIPPGADVAFAGFWSADGAMLAWAKAPKSSFRGRGVYIVDVAKLDLNAADTESA